MTFRKSIAGRDLIIDVGTLANQTNGSCTVQYGDTKVLATAVMSKSPRPDLDYFPLMVDFEERLYAAGKIKGSRFIKREGRPSDEATLTARLIDRSIRPLFKDSIRNDIQVVITALSVDGENDTDFPALVSASCALAISNIPWIGPIAGVLMGYKNGEFLINPTTEQRTNAEMEVFVSGFDNKTLMIECLGYEVNEETFLHSIEKAHEVIDEIVTFIKEVQKSVGKEKIKPDEGTQTEEHALMMSEIHDTVEKFADKRLKEIWGLKGKNQREEAMTSIFKDLDTELKSQEKSDIFRKTAQHILLDVVDRESRKLVIRDKSRVDGRKVDEIRPLSCMVGVLPRTHGSGLFNRGETQVLSIATLGSPGDEQTLDGMEESGTKRYMHHYNFPGFSVGEVKPMRSPGRREIGHGALAEKALVPVIPSKDAFPYTIRVVSEVLSSNGSSSQASICGSTLALMDAGVPIKAPVAGIAMGLVIDPENEENYEIITDIQGIEDHSGYMDFKVAGTKQGITAIQLDVKNLGLTFEMQKKTLQMAKNARMQILDTMEKVIATPREELSQYAPRIYTLRIDPEKIRDVIGRGGETINKIIDECGGRDVCKIDIEDDGLVMVTTKDSESGNRAITYIQNLTKEIEVDEVYEGVITRVVADRNSGKEIGAIVELVPGQDGMVHISEFSEDRINSVSDVAKVGDKLLVKVVEVDKERGRISLSHRLAINPNGQSKRDERPSNRDNFRGNNRGNFNRDNKRR